MKRVVIVHCWGGKSEYCWYPQVKKELEQQEFTVSVPAMPHTDEPKLSEWLPMLQREAGDPDEHLFLIGHSLGCPTILHYLQSLPGGKRIGGAVLVAGFAEDLGFEETHNFFTTPFDPALITPHVQKIVAIHSDDDPYVPLHCGEQLKQLFGAELIVKKGMRHFSGALDEPTACRALPDVVEAILHLAEQADQKR